MFNNFYNVIKNRVNYFKQESNVFEVEVDDEIEYTDEIEKALWEVKDSLDLPTEEIEIAIATRHKSLKNS
tara:strand:+ start:682 stop:891 length:210 start_codon:yes stop_codon:yes gene_type:complete